MSDSDKSELMQLARETRETCEGIRTGQAGMQTLIEAILDRVKSITDKHCSSDSGN